jgi:uncharacterized protein (UPF0261 family)
MQRTLAIVGCLDTKGTEVLYLKRVVEEQGLSALVVDAGVLGEGPFAADVSAAAVAGAAGADLGELRRRADRGAAVKAMAAGAARLVRQLFDAGRVHGVLAAGGSANTTIGSAVMRSLPVGVPKVMVSTLASGDVAPYVDTKDITMMYSVVDVAGLNRISARILGNAARAACAMAAAPDSLPLEAKPLVAATMFGVTTPCVTRARQVLEAAGYEVLVFHATGTGGRAMEGLIADGFFSGVLDLTTTELADELVGGVMSAGPDRLTVAGRVGIPQVVSVGAVDMVNFGPPHTVPERFRARRFYQHNPNVTLMRTTAEENREIGRRIALRLNPSRGPVRVFLPLRGVSLYDREGGVFHDAEATRSCLQAIQEHIDPRIGIRELDTDINAEDFAVACAEALIELLRDR